LTHDSGFRAAFRVGEFRALWAAEALSQLGDQLARVALMVLVYTRTNSAALAALTFALSFTPSFLGSALLSGIGDRFPRREVMIVCDLISTGLVLVMAVHGMPLWIVCVAMAGVSLVGGPFKSARLALLPEVLHGEAYVAGLAVRSMTIQSAQLFGLAAGGAILGLISPYLALTIDAGTFLVSAVLVRFGVPYRPAASEPGSRRSFWTSSIRGARQIAGIPGLRSLFVLGLLAGLYIAPEGLAAPWAHELGAPTWTVGLILAAPAGGMVAGAWLFTRFVGPARRPAVTAPLAALSGVVLAFCALRPGLWAVLVMLVLSGIFGAYHVQVGASFGTMTQADGRAQVMGLLNSGVLTIQGIGALGAGLLAEAISVAGTVGIAGAVGAVIAAATGLTWSRATRRSVPAETPAKAA